MSYDRLGLWLTVNNFTLHSKRDHIIYWYTTIYPRIFIYFNLFILASKYSSFNVYKIYCVYNQKKMQQHNIIICNLNNTK